MNDMEDVLALATAPSPEGASVAPIAIDTAAARLARQLATSTRRIIGLLPAGPTSNIDDLAIPLGHALVVVLGTMVIILDPERRGIELSSGAKKRPSQPARALASDGETALVYAHALGPNLVSIAPYAGAPTGAKVEAIKVLLRFAEEHADTFGCALVDLTSCVRPGELLGTLRLMDGIVIVGRVGTVTEKQLRTASSRVPEDLNLGVILTE